MRTILLDGEAKVGKTSVTNAIVEGLAECDYSVRQADAGAFFRQMTSAVLCRLDIDTADGVPDEFIDDALGKVIADGDVFERDFPFGDLERPAVGSLVSSIGRRALSQEAARGWWSRTAQDARASGDDVLVLNARNPRARLEAASEKVGICLELLVGCDVQVAGYRAARGKGIENPTEAQIACETTLIEKRRRMDRERADTPYVDPVFSLPREGLSMAEVIRKSWAPVSYLPPVPHPIDFDTTHLTYEVMELQAYGLAKCALQYVEKEVLVA